MIDVDDMLDHVVQFWITKAKKIYAELSLAKHREDVATHETLLRHTQAQDLDLSTNSCVLSETERQVFQELSHRFWLGDIPDDELLVIQSQSLSSRSVSEIQFLYRQYLANEASSDKNRTYPLSLSLSRGSIMSCEFVI